MSVNNGGPYNAMTEQPLNYPDIVIGLEQMSGKTVAKSLTRDPFDQPDLSNGPLVRCFLQKESSDLHCRSYYFRLPDRIRK